MARFSLIPKEEQYFGLFRQMTSHIYDAASKLAEMLAGKATEFQTHLDSIKAIEHTCDELTHSISKKLNSSFITPFDREDIYALAGRLDDVMDHMDAVADLVVLYRLDGLPRGVRQQVDVLCRAANLTAEAMPGLRSMKGLEEYWIEANRLENEADRVYRELLAELFSGQYDPLEVLKLKDVVEELEAAADAFEQVAHVVETVAVKES